MHKNIISQNLYFYRMNFVIVDVETTGGATNASKITEIALFKHNGTEIIDSYSTLINPEIPIPFFISKLTGITDDMVENSPTFKEVSLEIMEFSRGCIFVAHNVSFDYSMIRHEFKQLNIDYRLSHLCTVRASKYVLPGHESYSLGKLTKDLGIPLVGRHRAVGDAEATAKLFSILIQKDKNQLKSFIHTEIDTTRLNPKFDLFSLDSVPNKPGVYTFYNGSEELLYASKAKELKKQIERSLQDPELSFVEDIERFEYLLSGTELIAEIQECSVHVENTTNLSKNTKSENKKFGICIVLNNEGDAKLFISKSATLTGTVLKEFPTRKAALQSVSDFLDLYQLSSDLLLIAKEINPLFESQVDIEKISVKNSIVELACQFFIESNESYYLFGKGRTKYERSLVYVEHGKIVSYGFLPYYVLKQDQRYWIKFLTEKINLPQSQQILKKHLKRKSYFSKVEA